MKRDTANAPGERAGDFLLRNHGGHDRSVGRAAARILAASRTGEVRQKIRSFDLDNALTNKLHGLIWECLDYKTRAHSPHLGQTGGNLERSRAVLCNIKERFAPLQSDGSQCGP